MHPALEKRFRDLEERRRKLVGRVRELPQDKQNLKPDANHFSPAEMIMHMAMAEQFDVAFMRKNPPSTLTGKKPKVTFIFRKTVADMQNPVKEVRTLGAMVPKGACSLTEAETAWEEVRSDTKEYLEQVEGPDAPMVKFMFFFGLASASDYLTLIEAHHTYHEQRFPKV